MTATYVTHGVCDDAKCLYAVGPDCECACLGESHGAGYGQTVTSRISVLDVQDAVDEARRAARVAGRLAAERFTAKQAKLALTAARQAQAAAQPRSRGKFTKAA